MCSTTSLATRPYDSEPCYIGILVSWHELKTKSNGVFWSVLFCILPNDQWKKIWYCSTTPAPQLYNWSSMYLVDFAPCFTQPHMNSLIHTDSNWSWIIQQNWLFIGHHKSWVLITTLTIAHKKNMYHYVGHHMVNLITMNLPNIIVDESMSLYCILNDHTIIIHHIIMNIPCHQLFIIIVSIWLYDIIHWSWFP